jgi:lysozyme family protein
LGINTNWDKAKKYMSIKPNSKPQRSRDDSIALAATAGCKEPVFILGERGYYLDTMGKKGENDRGLYDDKIGIVWPEGHANFNANTDPSAYRKGSGTGSKKGIASLKAGRWLYKQGKHGINRGNPYPALVQADRVTVIRDGSPNYEDTGHFGINIHRGGDGTTSSLGCQTIVPDQWLTFQQLVYNLMKQYGLKTIPYVLVENTPELNKGVVVKEEVHGPLTKLFLSMKLTAFGLLNGEHVAKRVLAAQGRYELVAAFAEVPWWLVGIIHSLEGSSDFKTHLHNGDSLKMRTVNVPAGRPKTGNPPFTWEESAVDALNYDRMKNLDTLEKQLYALERFNGLGYRKKGINSPYLWSGSTHYTKGKYVRDGVWDANAVSKQIGAAVILNILHQMGKVNLKV